MRHPDIQHAVAFIGDTILNIPQQFRMSAGPHMGIAKLAFTNIFDLAAELAGYCLHTVTDPQDGYPQFEYFEWYLWGRRFQG